MLAAEALKELLSALEVGHGDATIGFDDIRYWSEEARTLLISCKLIKTAPAARVLECRGCEEHCLSEVVIGSARAGVSKPYIICGVPEKQAEMGRISVGKERLQRWQCSLESLAEVLRLALGLESDNHVRNGEGCMQLGMLQGPHGRRWVTLRASPLELEVNQDQVPVSEVLFIENGAMQFDMPRIRHLLSNQKLSAEKPYTSNTEKREARKHATTAMYQDWRDEHLRLKERKPGRSKSWYATQIARLPIACDRDSETIRKRLS